jgi:hypothetical protein
MSDNCNCGAQLAEGALFCHKCGRPTRELPDSESSGSMPVMTIQPVYPAVNFQNGVAVRIALLMAVGSTVVFFLPLLNWMAAGLCATLLYRRRTGYLLSLEAGLRLGGMTGVLIFAIILLMVTISAAVPDVKNALDPRVQQSLQVVFQSAGAVTQMLLLSFVSVTLSCMAGGVLGARLTRREP